MVEGYLESGGTRHAHRRHFFTMTNQEKTHD